jgi:inner membrane protein
MSSEGGFWIMMGRTHFAIGLATSLAVMQPKSVGECMAAVFAGALGGVTADNDTLNQSNSLKGQLLALKTALGALLIDYFFKLGICESIMANPKKALVGLIAFLVLWFIGFFSDHRTFTHSFLAMILYSLAIGLIYEPFTLGFMVAYLSHLALDILNRKKMPLLYPLDLGICLKLCYSDGKMDTFLMYVGYITTAVFLTIGLVSGF